MLKKLFFLFFFIIFLLNISSVLSYEDNRNLPEPYNQIEVLPFDPKKHFGKDQIEGLTFLIKKNNPKIVVEIGSYLGASTRFIAKLLPEEGKVFAVDHWLGNAEWQNNPSFKKERPILYQKFLSNVIHENLCDKIIPMKMTSLEAARIFNYLPDLIFIDGSHDFQSVYDDICAWYPYVENNGVLCGDDFNWGGNKSVKKAVLLFAKEHNLKVKTINNWFWYYER